MQRNEKLILTRDDLRSSQNPVTKLYVADDFFCQGDSLYKDINRSNILRDEKTWFESPSARKVPTVRRVYLNVCGEKFLLHSDHAKAESRETLLALITKTYIEKLRLTEQAAREKAEEELRIIEQGISQAESIFVTSLMTGAFAIRQAYDTDSEKAGVDALQTDMTISFPQLEVETVEKDFLVVSAEKADKNIAVIHNECRSVFKAEVNPKGQRQLRLQQIEVDGARDGLVPTLLMSERAPDFTGRFASEITPMGYLSSYNVHSINARNAELKAEHAQRVSRGSRRWFGLGVALIVVGIVLNALPIVGQVVGAWSICAGFMLSAPCFGKAMTALTEPLPVLASAPKAEIYQPPEFKNADAATDDEPASEHEPLISVESRLRKNTGAEFKVGNVAKPSELLDGLNYEDVSVAPRKNSSSLPADDNHAPVVSSMPGDSSHLVSDDDKEETMRRRNTK